MSVGDPRLVRESLAALLEATEAKDLVAALNATGWCEMYDADAPVAVGALFDTQGELLASTPMLGVILRLALLHHHDVPEYLPAPALLPMPGTGDAPPAVLGDDGSVRLNGCLLGMFSGDSVVTAASTPAGSIAVFELDTAGLTFRPVRGLDPSLMLSRVDGTIGAPSARALADDAGEAWDRAVAIGRLALSHELIATADGALTLAVAHARQRVQFGQPIGAFQAVQHRLADATVAVEVARFALEEGWRHRAHHTAALAKALAGRAARTTGVHAQQVLGGMGFSWEHPFHRKLRRMLSLDLLLGSCTQVERQIGIELLRGDGLPELRAL